MGTKLRSLATSAITKTILWIIFISLSFTAVMGLVLVMRTSSTNDLPAESLYAVEYSDSQSFITSKCDIVSALYWNYSIEKLYNIDKLPTIYYRAEYENGTVTANTPENADFFKAHKVYGIYRTLPNGDWHELDKSHDRVNINPPSVSYGTSYVFSEKHHVYVDNYAQAVTAPNIFTQEPPPDIPKVFNSIIYTGWRNASAIPAGRYAQSNAFYDTEVMEEETTDEDINAQYAAWVNEHPVPQATVYYAFDDSSLAAYEAYWQQCRSYYVMQLILLGTLVLGALAAAIWLLCACGRRPADTELHLLPSDKLWSELTVVAGLTFTFFLFAIFIVGAENIVINKMYNDLLIVSFYGIGVTALAIIVLYLAMSIIRLLKGKMLIRSSLTFKACRFCWQPVNKAIDMLRACFDERAFKNYPLTAALQKRQLAFFSILGGFLLLMMFMSLFSGSGFLFVFLLLSAALLGAFAYWQMRGNMNTYEEINKGFNESFEEQMKSERTKTALITNVSHDLKTPLTSIITYVNLLSQEELSDTARDYVTILAQKSERLKSIVSDLFDLSKSASGNIPLDMEVLDLKRLIEQTIADMRDSIDASELILKTKLPEGEVNIFADGKKLYRVFQNIIDNALKYSMAGTRVFITLESENGRAIATLKNTAAYEMDFTAEEVLQRFSRGDNKARSGDGSGLGLSIAESFTKACGGDFRVELDGDLFKVTIEFAAK
ncbi:MAG: HAMP domain-containing sensor histidine kinase [Angelakisella sp.]